MLKLERVQNLFTVSTFQKMKYSQNSHTNNISKIIDLGFRHLDDLTELNFAGLAMKHLTNTSTISLVSRKTI